MRHANRLVGCLLKAIHPAAQLVGNGMIGIGLAHNGTHRLGVAGAYPLTFVRDQVERFYSIVVEAVEVFLPIVGFAAAGHLDAKNSAAARIDRHQDRNALREDLVAGKYKIADHSVFRAKCRWQQRSDAR
jgi:hypothetical protein